MTIQNIYFKIYVTILKENYYNIISLDDVYHSHIMACTMFYKIGPQNGITSQLRI